ncbi:MAG: DUF368 domain-containing protein [Lachnospiraceae bacterium]|jgi:putative membrane protein|nr:DUF368 domain-containing protein [Lachnospiraceae bacterium]
MDRFLMLKAFLIGGSMLIPGVSGGTMAMIFGVYGRLIFSVSSHKKEDLLFLLRFVAGAGAAFLLLSAPMAALNRHFPAEMAFFVLGIMVGGVPVIYRAAGHPGLSGRTVAYLAAGILLVFLLRLLPDHIFQGGRVSLSGILIQFAAGILGALALVLPGISFSSMLYIMGVYDFILTSLGTGQIFLLIPFLLGGFLGVLCLTRFLDRAMKHHPKVSYMIILGFVMASLWDIFAALPALPEKESLLLCLFLSAAGFLITWLMAKADSRSPALDSSSHFPDKDISREPSPAENQRRFCQFPLPRRKR